jgi:hypothetical protein
MDLCDEINKLNETLKTECDELKLKIHFGKMEAQEEWGNVEKQWRHFQAKANELGSASKESAQEVRAAVKLLGEEVVHAFSRIQKSS